MIASQFICEMYTDITDLPHRMFSVYTDLYSDTDSSLSRRNTHAEVDLHIAQLQRKALGMSEKN